MNSFTVIIITVVMVTNGHEIAKEVEGGVQILHTGQLELILPERLNFTVKRLHAGQECIGHFVMCYETIATVRYTGEEQEWYMNDRPPCAKGTCLLVIHPDNVYGLTMRSDSNHVFGIFNDNSHLACPRKVVDSQTTFTIKELPDCPVFINGARLPTNKGKVNDGKSTIKWVVAGSVAAVLLFVIAGAVGFCVFMRFKNNPDLIKSEDHVQRVSKSARSPMTRNKPSPMNTPVDD
uniref:Uncharacterized protein n=1 Tax=Panagrellus redivivus TaxID=6233 RepID=A0A7E4ZYX0_PANRE